jgi:hypothetical protein
MNDLPAPTAEGKLIRQARELAIPRLSIRAAAARIGMSPEQWGNIERGYRYTKPNDPPRPFSHAPATTIAKMASAVGISPEHLESEGKRPDAADILREIERRESTAQPPRHEKRRRLPEASPEMAAAMKDHVAAFKELAEAAKRAHPGEQLTGAMIFPKSESVAAWYWDRLQADNWEPEDIPGGVAAMVVWDEEEARLEQESGFAAESRQQSALSR